MPKFKLEVAFADDFENTAPELSGAAAVWMVEGDSIRNVDYTVFNFGS